VLVEGEGDGIPRHGNRTSRDKDTKRKDK